MIRELIALEGESLYDLTIRAYETMRGYPDILRLNPNLEGVDINGILTFIGDTIYYDDSLLFPGIVPESFLPERTSLPDYLIVEGQSMYDLGVQLYGDMTEGMRQLLPYLENTDRGTFVKRTVPVSNIGEVFNDNNVVVATKPEFEEDTRISLEGGLEMPVVGTGGNIFDNTFSPPFN